MKIVFFDPVHWDYSPVTPYQKPLGGTQSAVCYLSTALSELGHQVYLINNISNSKEINGVNCLNVRSNDEYLKEIINSSDICIVIALPSLVNGLKSLFTGKVKFFLWCQHSYNQPVLESLYSSEVKKSWDGYIFVSNWQRDKFCSVFALEKNKTFILRNAISPLIYNLFDKKESISKSKKLEDTIFYSSTPFRGLDILIDVFPSIKKKLPKVKLKVFSCLKTYQIDKDNDNYLYLYKQCEAMNGVEYIGSLSQSELAPHLKKASILAYPNSFEETSCISVMEALASGCAVVTSELGALPETSSGFASLVKGKPGSDQYKKNFIDEIDKTYKLFKGDDCFLDRKLRNQVDYFLLNNNWERRAQELIEIIQDY
ncbi:glycosyltransferase family 4 protein [Prochlorococcus sp. MIT 0801]|uniref:glycosyltransferase family 4 protein n=1 Tax=Prochlorococcus sp. MIT 0801 TaxID=1501269 RepID=UPI0004F58917|nr:glycosyltransferase family 4 protein [Prochlorococcus sp. MIT 0801]AIQ97728.1 putative glycosyl-transferase [Prochlorococcus sp. MIT 0801]